MKNLIEYDWLELGETQAPRSCSFDEDSLAETDITEGTATTETTLVETNFYELQVSWIDPHPLPRFLPIIGWFRELLSRSLRDSLPGIQILSSASHVTE